VSCFPELKLGVGEMHTEDMPMMRILVEAENKWCSNFCSYQTPESGVCADKVPALIPGSGNY
jgi:hypothetical protein